MGGRVEDRMLDEDQPLGPPQLLSTQITETVEFWERHPKIADCVLHIFEEYTSGAGHAQCHFLVQTTSVDRDYAHFSMILYRNARILYRGTERRAESIPVVLTGV